MKYIKFYTKYYTFEMKKGCFHVESLNQDIVQMVKSKASQIDSTRIIQENNQKIMDQERENEYKNPIQVILTEPFTFFQK